MLSELVRAENVLSKLVRAENDNPLLLFIRKSVDERVKCLDQPNEPLRKLTDPIFECVLSSFRRYYEDYEQGPRTQGRLGKILLSNIYIDSCQPDLLEQLFFSGIIGSVNIDSVIPYILSMEIPQPPESCHSDALMEESESETDNISSPC